MKRAKYPATILAIIFLLSFLAACNANTPGSDQPELPPEPTEDGGATYADPTYYPIVANPITLEATIQQMGDQGEIADRVLWQTIKEETGITIGLRILIDGYDTAKLIFAAKDYPDISFRVGSFDTQISEAINQKDIIEITPEMLNSFAPNWAEIFKKYPDFYARSLHYDGKLYSFPQLSYSPWNINLRDTIMVNGEWLDELGLNTPATLDEYTAYLRAVKNAAGTGSIPTGVTPLVIRGNAYIGGWNTIADWFGLYNGTYDEIIVNGKIRCNAQDEKLKPVLKYVATLVSEGLVNKNCGTIDKNSYNALVDSTGTQTTPWAVGSYFEFNNYGHMQMIYIEPPKVEGYETFVHQSGLESRYGKNNFFIFSKCKYPVAAVRLANWLGGEEGTLINCIGVEDYIWERKESGEIIRIPENARGSAEDYTKLGLSNYGVGILTEEMMTQLYSGDLDDPAQRIWAYYNLYEKYIPKEYEPFPVPALQYLTDDELKEYNDLHSKVNSYITTWSRAVVSGSVNADADWDNFQQKLKDLGVERLLELQQKAYDAYIPG